MASSAPSRAAPRRLVTGTSVFLLLLVAVLGFAAFSGYRRWHSARTRLCDLQTELATLKGSREGLAAAHEAVQNRRFAVCNRTTDQVVVPWLAAVYQVGDGLRVFDSSRCPAWTPLPVPTGGAPRNLAFRASPAECNWDGSVIMYAMRVTRTSAAGVSRSVNSTGPWKGFERDCFTVQ